MIDGNNTSIEWQRHRTDIIVLPVGAMEQHGTHLPVNTDAWLAEYAARRVAERFDAALLPVIGVANSLEHSGFRGSFSLRPETLMAVIRDMADEAERQGFTIMLVINGHGGNFALGPVCRDINRLDRGIKLILAAPFSGIGGGDIMETRRDGIMDIHAGEVETSIYMHLSGRACKAPECGGNLTNLAQTDLTTFGVGHFNPLGVPGRPDLASEEKGKALCEQRWPVFMAQIEERVARLRKTRNYSGAGGMVSRVLDCSDLPRLLELSLSVNWNQYAADWKFFIDSGMVLGMVRQNRIIGTAAISGWRKRLASIGLVITEPQWRGCSIATRLMVELLERYADYKTIKLDASAAGAPLYAKLGFQAEKNVCRVSFRHLPRIEAVGDLDWRPMHETDVPELAKRESGFTGVERPEVFLTFLREYSGMAHVGMRGGRIASWFLGRTGRLFRQVGALGADSLEDALAAVAYFAQLDPSVPFQVDIPETQAEFLDELKKLGAHPERNFLRMYRGEPCGDWYDKQLFAIFGPEMG